MAIRHHTHNYSTSRHAGHGDPLFMAAMMASAEKHANKDEDIPTRQTFGHGDPLFSEVRHHNPRPCQILPSYPEFRLGQGDPLMKAVMVHWNKDMIPHNVNPEQPNHQRTFHARRQFNDFMKLLGSPLYGWICYFHDMFVRENYMDDMQRRCMAITSPLFGWIDYYNNVLHFDRTRYTDVADVDEVVDVRVDSPVVTLQEHGSPLCYYNDHVHIDKDTVVTFPCLPTEVDNEDEEEEAKVVVEEVATVSTSGGTIISAASGDPLLEAAMRYNSIMNPVAEERNDRDDFKRSNSGGVEPDPVFREVCYHDPRPTQIVPRYGEFRLGHGDPILKAAMNHHTKDMIFTPNSPRPSIGKESVDRQNIVKNLQQLSLPIYDYTPYYTDVVHLDRTALASAMSSQDPKKRGEVDPHHDTPTSPKGIRDLKMHGGYYPVIPSE